MLAINGWHCALGGSVLIKGESTKDLDLFIYPNNLETTTLKDEIRSELSRVFTFYAWEKCQHPKDLKEVWKCRMDGKRIDIFFVQ